MLFTYICYIKPLLPPLLSLPNNVTSFGKTVMIVLYYYYYVNTVFCRVMLYPVTSFLTFFPPRINLSLSLFFFFFLPLLWPHLWHMEVPRLGIGAELHLQACATATTTLDLSRFCDLHSNLWQHWILNPLSEARDHTYILTDTVLS